MGTASDHLCSSFVCSYLFTTFLFLCLLPSFVCSLSTAVLCTYGPKALFGQAENEMRATLRPRNRLVGNMHETLWYLLMDALENRHLFGQNNECKIHRDTTWGARIPVRFVLLPRRQRWQRRCRHGIRILETDYIDLHASSCMCSYRI